MFDASFPHSGHVDWVSCQSCHPAIYPYRDAEITMAEINQGESCGRCHSKVAFPVSACGRCHERMPLSNSGKPATFLGDLTLERKADSIQVATMSSPYPPARFPHWVHRIRYRCTACHPDPWEERLGATTMTMSEMQAGELCGACHNGGDAFGLFECVTCHSPAEAPSDPEP
jgi:c(7)-type cytochrome triheme protein